MANTSSSITHSVTCLIAAERKMKNAHGSIENRVYSAFFMPTSDRIIYKFDGGTVEAERGDVVHLPKGSSYSFSFIGDTRSYLVINFEFSEHDGDGGELSALGKRISKVAVDENDYIVKFHNVINGYDSHMLPQRLRALAEICDMLSLFSGASYESRGRIDAGLSYIDEHKLDAVYIEDAARECGLSVAHFRRLFKDTYGESPIKYLSNLRTDYAAELLRSGYFSVENVSEMAGFNDPKYFSVVVKQRYGLPPSKLK